MGFLDELRKLTQPIDEEDDFYDDADDSLSQSTQPSEAQMVLENTFGAETGGKPEPAAAPKKPAKAQNEGGGIFSGRGSKKAGKAKPHRERTVDWGGTETQVILFNPKTFDEAGDLVNQLNQGRSVVMTLEGVPTENARRLLDFLSGITYALQGKITPISAKTYFVTPQNVDVLGAQADQPENEGQYL